VATSIGRQIAEVLRVREQQVEAAVALLDGGATEPFIARYRKEATGSLDDAQLRTLEERLHYLRELEERRAVILNSIREQGKLDAALETAILATDSKGRDDLVPGMVLEGAVTNVAAFGAFVDIGVHQDGLVHVSAMAKTFVKDPREIVKPGDIVRVKVLDVDKPRKRIALTLRLDDEIGHDRGNAVTAAARPDAGQRTLPPRQNEPTSGGALADALRRAGLTTDKNGANRTKPR
jgi:transcriptional accessory protein Tex/SPT6